MGGSLWLARAEARARARRSARPHLPRRWRAIVRTNEQHTPSMLPHNACTRRVRAERWYWGRLQAYSCARRSYGVAVATGAVVGGAALLSSCVGRCEGNAGRPKEDKLEECDVLIVGGGVVGLSTAYHLTRRGKRVVLCNAGHSVRGSWGETRAAHLAQTDDLRLRMARRGVGWYKQLEKQTGVQFLIHSERLNIGPRHYIETLCSSYRRGKVNYTRLNPAEVASRWEEQIRLAVDEEAVLIAHGWTVLASEALRALAMAVESAGAVCRDDEAVITIDTNKQLVRTDMGRTIRYHQAMVLAAGAWTNQLLQLADLPLLPIAVTEEQTVQFSLRERRPAIATDGPPALPLITHVNPEQQECLLRSLSASALESVFPFSRSLCSEV
eukprot:COSAG02_NODE_306_length_25175_cov_76.540118_13_plen_384_part_00